MQEYIRQEAPTETYLMIGHGVASKYRSAVPRVLTRSVLPVAEPLLGSAQGV